MSSGTASSLLFWLRQAFRRDAPAEADAPLPAPDAGAPVLEKLRLVRERLASAAGKDAAAAYAAQRLGRLEARLRRPPRIALLGEFNAGKSSLVRLLLEIGGGLPLGAAAEAAGQALHAPILFRYGEQPALFAVQTDGRRTMLDPSAMGPWRGAPLRLLEAHLPSNLLRRLEIIDVPGVADPLRDAHEYLRKMSRSVHLALWCTTATQAWKGSEQRAWLALPRRLRPVSLLVATHKDLLPGSADAGKVLARLRRETAQYFRGVALISVTEAMQARRKLQERGPGPEFWQSSGGAMFLPGLAEAISAVTANRQRSALRAAQRIAARALSWPHAPQEAGDAAMLLAAWSKLAGALSKRLDGATAADPALFTGFAGELSLFASDTLSPWLHRHSSPEPASQIVALFPREPAVLAEAVAGLSGEATAKRLRGVLRQLGEELTEALANQQTQPPAPGDPRQETRLALEPLFEFPASMELNQSGISR